MSTTPPTPPEAPPENSPENPLEAALCPLTTHAALARAAALAPEVEAIVGPGGRLTYAQLHAEVETIRHALAAAGIRHGEHVGICAGNGPRWMALFLALGSLGAVTVPINTRLKADEIAYALRQSRVRTLFLAQHLLGIDFLALLRSIEPAIEPAIDATLPQPLAQSLPRTLPGKNLPDLHRLIVLDRDWPAFLANATPTPPACTPNDTLLIQYTSGTTAFPKGVLLRHRSMLGDGFVSGARMGLRVADRFHSARPFFHVAGSSLSILACVQHAATLVTMERFEPAEALALLESERCTHVSGNDTIALMLLNHPDRPRRRLHLRGAWFAASPTIVRRVIDELGATECVVGYGLSEASPNVAQSAWWEPEPIRVAGLMRPQPGVEIRISPQGKPQAEIEGEIAGEPQGEIAGEPQGKIEGEPQGKIEGEPQGEIEGEPQGKIEGDPQGKIEGEPQGKIEGEPQGKIEGKIEGEIQVRGYTVMQGYFDKPAETAAALSPEGWLSTGDLGRIHEDGRLEFLGRLKDIVRVGGENVSPAEVEDILNRHPAIRQAVVVGVPDPRLTEVTCAFLILNHHADPAAIRDWASTRMAAFKLPRYIQVVDGFDHIGMTASSKIQKPRLRQHAIDLLGLA